jgi:exodeoxyribonuclease V gamma subunit
VGVDVDAAFSKPALAWRIQDILMARPDIAGLEVPRAYCTGKTPSAVFQLATRIADLLDQYLTYRPTWILDWEDGIDLKVPDERASRHAHWQAVLWRELSKGDHPHRAQLFARLFQSLQKGKVPGFPDTISVFGAHSLPPIFLQVLKALSLHHEVVFYLTQPTPVFWGDQPLRALQHLRTPFRTETCQTGTRGVHPEGHPLLHSLGDQGRDMFNVLIDLDLSSTESDDASLFVAPEQEHLLGRLQRSIFDQQELTLEARPSPADDSLRIHCCHHPLREVEILHDCLLAFFSENPELKPGDILVLTPDMDTYAPLIEAVFNKPASAEEAIPFSIADRAVREQSQVIDAFFRLLDLCQGRFPVADVLALVHNPAIAGRFGWTPEDLSRMRTWLRDLGTAWGLDEEHRRVLGFPAYKDYSWGEALERLFLGYAMRPNAEDAEEALIYDRVEGSDATLIGRLADMLSLLQAAATGLSGSLPAQAWADRIESLVVTPFLESQDTTMVERGQVIEALDVLREATRNLSVEVDLHAIHTFLEGTVEDALPARGFLRHGVTFARLTPMRAIPRKVVCVLGLNHGDFPRDPAPLEFNLMAMKGMARPGDRSARQSDRYLFLETLLSAREKLHLSYCGQSSFSGDLCPPSVVLGEVLDLLQAADPVSPEEPPPGPFVVRHRLHGHNRDYFQGGGQDLLFSYSKPHYEAAASSADPKTELPAPEILLPEGCEIRLPDLLAFFQHPAKAFARERLGLTLPACDENRDTEEPLSLDSLSAFWLRADTATRELGGETPGRPRHLPPGAYGKWLEKETIRQTHDAMESVLQAFPELDGPEEKVSLSITLPVGQQTLLLSGELSHVYPERILYFRPADKLRGMDRLRAWIGHLAIAATGASRPTRLVCLKQSKKGNTFPPIEQDRALEHLADLANLFLQGMRAPLPFEPSCSEAAAKEEQENAALNAALRKWEGGKFDPTTPPSKDPWIIACWGTQTPFHEGVKSAFLNNAQCVFGPMQAELR